MTTWADFEARFAHDARFSQPHDPLDLPQKHQLFDEHVSHMRDRKRQQLAQLFEKHALDDQGHERLDIEADVVLTHAKNDDKYHNSGIKRFVRDDYAVLEREYQEWNDWRQARARADFQKMLEGASLGLVAAHQRKRVRGFLGQAPQGEGTAH